MQLVLVTPRATEKSYRLITSQNTYIFDVPLSANKQQIAAAVEAQYDGTKVANVTTAVQSARPFATAGASAATQAPHTATIAKRRTSA